MHLPPVLAAGLFLALLAAAMEAKPAPPHLHKRSQGGGNAAALGRELADLLEAAAAAAAGAAPGPGPGPPVAGGSAAGSARGGGAGAKQEAKKGKGNAGATSRLMRDLRTDSKRTRGAWSRAGNPEHHFSAGGGGGGSRRRKGPGRNQACFGLKLDRVGTMSGLGC